MSYVRANTANPNGFRPWNSRLSGLAGPRVLVRRRMGLGYLGDSPAGAVDSLNYYARILTVSGWAGDKAGGNVASVMVYVDGQPFASAQLGIARGDVPMNSKDGAVASSWGQSGWQAQASTASLSAGSHSVSVVAVAHDGTQTTLGSNVPLTFQIPAPEGSMSVTGSAAPAVSPAPFFAVSPTGVPIAMPASSAATPTSSSANGIWNALQAPVTLPIIGSIPLIYLLGGAATLALMFADRGGHR